MKKIALVLLLLVLIGSGALANPPQRIRGLDLPSFGQVRTNSDGEIVGYRGFNFGLGYSWVGYIGGCEPERVNFFYGVGTLVFVLPYAQVGADYLLPAERIFGPLEGIFGSAEGHYRLSLTAGAVTTVACPYVRPMVGMGISYVY